MLHATAMELQMESLELQTVFRAGALSVINRDNLQQVAEESQKNIRLANELRSFYLKEQNQLTRLEQDVKTQMSLFQALDEAGLLEKIMEHPV